MLIIGPDPFISQSSPESIFHSMKSRDQTSVLLSVLWRLSPQLRSGKRYRPELIFRYHINKKVDIKT